MFLLRALAKYDQKVYASSLSGYKNLNESMNPAAKKSVISSRSSLVNPAFLVFVFGFFKSAGAYNDRQISLFNAEYSAFLDPTNEQPSYEHTYFFVGHIQVTADNNRFLLI